MKNTYSMFNHNYQIKLTALTPIAIGNGDTLSPYADYVYNEQENKAYLIDRGKINEEVTKKGLEDRYIEAIYASFDNNRANFDLKLFLEKELHLTPNQYAIQAIPCYGMQRNYRREVKAILKDNGKPFIAGSSLKGAIKTALLYDWLGDEENTSFNRLMKKVLSKYKECERQINDLERINDKRRLSPYDKKEIKRLTFIITKKTWGLEKLFDTVFNEFMDNEEKYFPKDFSLFRVSDSDLFTKESVCYQLTNRLHYRKGTSAIPVNLEAIKKGETSKFRLSIYPSITRKDLAFLNDKEDAIIKLFQRINNFSKDNVDMELELLERFDVRPNNLINKFQFFLDNLYDQIDQVNNSTAYLPIGFGKSFFYNSIGMLVNDWNGTNSNLSDYDLSLFKKYCKLFFIGKIGQKHFPLTRTVNSFGESMGWLKIEYQNNNNE